jgi:signal transduction histidine kinase
MAMVNNMAIFGFLSLAGGILFDALGAWFELEPRDTAYALLVPPAYFLLAGANLALVAVTSPGLEGIDPRRVFRESGLPPLPVELLNALMAAAVVLLWAHAGLAAAAALLLLLLITVPLLRVISGALKNGDDLLELRHVSDERAAEVERLASDRDRLLSEVLDAEERERARLAESLHDGPMQRLIALRQDAAETGGVMAGSLDKAIAETRAIISAFHPVMVRERGFEASLRAAIAPFPTAHSVDLTVVTEVDDRYLAETLLLPVAPELVVNAVKHASPTTIELSIRRGRRSTCLGGQRRRRWHRHVRRRTRRPGRSNASPKREWPRSKRPRPFVGRMFYYVLDIPRLTCVSSKKRCPVRGGSRTRGEGGKHGLPHLIS